MSNSLTELKEVANAAARRDGLIVQARRDGHTWREIANALNMTDLAVRKAAERSNGGVVPQPDAKRARG